MYPPSRKDFISLTLSDPHSHSYNNGKHRRQSCWRVSSPVVQYVDLEFRHTCVLPLWHRNWDRGSCKWSAIAAETQRERVNIWWQWWKIPSSVTVHLISNGDTACREVKNKTIKLNKYVERHNQYNCFHTSSLYSLRSIQLNSKRLWKILAHTFISGAEKSLPVDRMSFLVAQPVLLSSDRGSVKRPQLWAPNCLFMFQITSLR